MKYLWKLTGLSNVFFDYFCCVAKIRSYLAYNKSFIFEHFLGIISKWKVDSVIVKPIVSLW